MMILFPDTIAVHSTTSGELLWKRELESWQVLEHDPYRPCPDVFITKDIVGFINFSKDSKSGVYRQTVLMVYDTGTGDYIGSATIPPEKAQGDTSNRKHKFARGCYIGYQLSQSVCVYRVEEKEIRRYEFGLPKKYRYFTHFYLQRSVNMFKYELLGFLGKTNCLMISFEQEGKFVRMCCLDLDAAFVAKTKREVESAFSLTKGCESLGSPERNFDPVYRTDRDTGCVELVGFMRQNDTSSSSRTFTVDTGFFVTEMETPSDN